TEARLMHRENQHYGFRFDSIEADGMIHLRRLMELNVSTEDEIEKELSFLNN
ncbi:MAG: PilZ domain-containing protein, partial [Spirochaetes bacterium]